MKTLFLGVILAGSLFSSAFAQQEPCHDVRLTTDYLKTYGFTQQWVGTIPGQGTIAIFQDSDGRWTQYMITLDTQTNTPVMCSITAGDKGVNSK